MWTKSPLLKKFEQLKELGFPLIKEPGTKICRGYADLGYEEFLLLNEEKMVSLFSGKISALPEDHEKFFFTVLSIDEMAESIQRLGDIQSLLCIDQRSWKMTVIINGDEVVSEGRSIEEVYTFMLLKIYENGMK